MLTLILLREISQALTQNIALFYAKDRKSLREPSQNLRKTSHFLREPSQKLREPSQFLRKGSQNLRESTYFFIQKHVKFTQNIAFYFFGGKC